jgi:amino acid transporter
MWSGMTIIFFSMIGFEVVAVTAAENRDLKQEETVKIASRKIALRVILLYTLAAFSVGLNVPYTDSSLRDLTINGIGGGQGSVFIIAALREHVRSWPYFFNGFFVFSAASAGMNALYSASRSLHALASLHDAWPRWGPIESLRSRLERTRFGVPYNAVFASWLFGFLAFLSTKHAPAQVSQLHKGPVIPNFKY